MSSLFKALRFVEDGLVLVLLFAMIGIAGSQIVARNFFDIGLTWAEPSLRMMVLWLGLMAAMIATRDQRHINVDVLAHWLSPSALRWVTRFNNLVAGTVCGVLAWHALRFVLLEREYPAEGALGLPTWVLALILPVSLSVMSLRFALHALLGRVPDLKATV